MNNMRNKILSLLGLLLLVASGTWAQEVTVTKTDGKTNEWTLTMPAGNVTVNVVYFDKAKLAMSTDETPVELAPKANTGIKAATDDAIIEAGTVANIGTSEVKQGTLMYYAAQSATDAAPTAPDYDTEGWTDKVPTAENFQEGDVYVWYYIQGAEPATGTERTDANTCSDGDICATPIKVTLLAAPVYTISFDPAPVKNMTVTAGSEAKTPTDEGKIEAVKLGTEVKLKASEGYKFKTVEVKNTDVTLNEAKTEATFAMPASDADVVYELVRDITQKVDVEVRIDGTATERVRIAKDDEGHYKFVTKQEWGWQFAAVDKLDNNKDLTNGEMIYTFKKKVGDQYEAVNTETDLCPGTWRLEAEANPEKPYDGIAYGKDIELYEATNITFAKGYSTHFYAESLVLDEVQDGLKFYAVSAVSDTKVTLTEIEAKAIPAETPFIAYNAGAEAITVAMGLLKADAVSTAAQFKGSVTEKKMDA